MTKIEAYIELWGETFTPSKCSNSSKVVFYKYNNPGDIAKTGKHKNQEYPYGAATIHNSDSSLSEVEKILWVFEQYKQVKDTTEFSKIEMRRVHFLLLYNQQCNVEIPIEILSKLAELDIELTISAEENND